MSLFTCPAATALTEIPKPDCKEHFGQIQRLIFQRKLKADGSRNEFVISTANPNALASWTALKSATDSTKVVLSPEVGAVELPVNEERTFGSGNEVPNGIPISLGAQPSAMNGRVYHSKAEVIRALKKLRGEAQLTVYLVNQYGQIAGAADDTGTPTKFAGFDVDKFFVSDKGSGGYDGIDFHNFSLQMPENWSDQFHIVTPTDFDPRVDI